MIAILLTVAICLFINYILYKFYSLKLQTTKLPPGPKPIPFFGSYHGENKQMVYRNMVEKFEPLFGKLITLFWGDSPIIFVNDLETAMHLYGQNNGRKVAGRKSSYLDIIVSSNKNNLFQLDYGPKWRSLVRTTKDGIIKTLAEKRIALDINKSIHMYCNELMKNPDNEKGLFPFDESYWLSDNVILTCFIGQIFDYDDVDYKTLYQSRRDVFDVLDNADFANWVPFAHYLPIPSVIKVKTQNNKLNELLQSFIGKLKAKNGYKTDPHTIGEHMFNLIENSSSEIELELNDNNVVQVFKDMLFASYEGIGLTNIWFIGLLALNPNIQEKIRTQSHEVSKVLNESTPNLNWREKLPYVIAVTHEFFRWTSLVGILDFHYSLESVEVENPSPEQANTPSHYTVPKGCYIGINQYALNHDPKAFPNPHEIHPENFLDKETGAFVDRREFWGFGYGVRMCPGVPITKGYVFLLLCNLCMFYKIEWTAENDKEELEDDPEISGLFRYPKPFHVKFTKL